MRWPHGFQVGQCRGGDAPGARGLATDDEMTENNISFEEEKCAPQPSGSIPSSKSVLVSNIIKDIQIAVANVPITQKRC